MTAFPSRITFEQVAKACEALGIDGSGLARLVIEGDTGVTATFADGGMAHVPLRFEWDRPGEAEFMLSAAGEQLDADTIAQLRRT